VDEVANALARDAGIQLEGTEPGTLGETTAKKHGLIRRNQGFDLSRVVHDYGLVCEATTEAAIRYGKHIEPREFQILSRCIDEGITLAIESCSSYKKTEAEHAGFLAHEIRNAVGNASLGFELITRGKATTDSRTADVVHRALSRISTLVANALVEVRLEASSIAERAQFALRDILKVIVADTPTEREIEVTLDAGEDLMIEADPVLLTSAITNLLQNAIKFTHDRTTITVRAREADAAAVVIEVEDRCGGLPAGALDEMFRPFVQKATDQRGAGLGLAIARRAIEAHGGTLACRDIAGVGCVFEALLPRTTRILDAPDLGFHN